MIAFVSYIIALLLVTSAPVSASPLPSKLGPIQISGISLKGLLCDIPIVNLLCPTKGVAVPSVTTTIGKALGVADSLGSLRFPVKYGSAARWQASSMATTWALP